MQKRYEVTEEELLKACETSSSVKEAAVKLGFIKNDGQVNYKLFHNKLKKYNIQNSLNSKINENHKNITKQLFDDAILNSSCISDVLRKLNVKPSGGNFKVFYRKAKKFGYDIDVLISKFEPVNHNIRKTKISIENYLKLGTSIGSYALKKKILAANLLENKCSICTSLPIWQNKILNLILDHINGINDDNRLENLRLVCPNCNSQLDTHCGKNKRKTPKITSEALS